MKSFSQFIVEVQTPDPWKVSDEDKKTLQRMKDAEDPKSTKKLQRNLDLKNRQKPRGQDSPSNSSEKLDVKTRSKTASSAASRYTRGADGRFTPDAIQNYALEKNSSGIIGGRNKSGKDRTGKTISDDKIRQITSEVSRTRKAYDRGEKWAVDKFNKLEQELDKKYPDASMKRGGERSRGGSGKAKNSNKGSSSQSGSSSGGRSQPPQGSGKDKGRPNKSGGTRSGQIVPSPGGKIDPYKYPVTDIEKYQRGTKKTTARIPSSRRTPPFSTVTGGSSLPSSQTNIDLNALPPAEREQIRKALRPGSARPRGALSSAEAAAEFRREMEAARAAAQDTSVQGLRDQKPQTEKPTTQPGVKQSTQTETEKDSKKSNNKKARTRQRGSSSGERRRSGAEGRRIRTIDRNKKSTTVPGKTPGPSRGAPGTLNLPQVSGAPRGGSVTLPQTTGSGSGSVDVSKRTGTDKGSGTVDLTKKGGKTLPGKRFAGGMAGAILYQLLQQPAKDAGDWLGLQLAKGITALGDDDVKRRTSTFNPALVDKAGPNINDLPQGSQTRQWFDNAIKKSNELGRKLTPDEVEDLKPKPTKLPANPYYDPEYLPFKEPGQSNTDYIKNLPNQIATAFGQRPANTTGKKSDSETSTSPETETKPETSTPIIVPPIIPPLPGRGSGNNNDKGNKNNNKNNKNRRRRLRLPGIPGLDGSISPIASVTASVPGIKPYVSQI